MSTENSDNKLATVVTVKFTYTDGGRWHSLDVTCAELLSILQTGKIDDKNICAVEVFSVTNEEEEKVSFIYDFVMQHVVSSTNPWRVA